MQTVTKTVKEVLGEQTVVKEFLTTEDSTPADKEKLLKRLGNMGIQEWKICEEICEQECQSTLPYLPVKDKAIRNIMWSVGYKFVLTGAGNYAIRYMGDFINYEVLIPHIDESCSYRKATPAISETIKDGEFDLKEMLIDGKIFWVYDLKTFNVGKVLIKDSNKLGVDLEGSLGVWIFI